MHTRRPGTRRGDRRRWSTWLRAAACAAVLAAPAPAPAAAATVPGSAGTPQPNTPVFLEDFENGMTNAPDGAKSYTTTGGATQYIGAAGQTYTGSSQWIEGNRCNGIVLSYANATTPPWAATPTLADRCSESVNVQSYNGVRTLARAMGLFTGSGDTEHIVSGYTECSLNSATGSITFCGVIGSGPAVGVMFQTTSVIPVTPGHFYTFGVDTVYGNCADSANTAAQASDPRYQFQLIDSAGAATNVGGQLNGCRPSPTRQTYIVDRPQPVGIPPLTPITQMTAYVSSLIADAPFKYDATTLGIRMYNASGVTNGNDGGFDNIKLLDVTPQLDKAFSPTTIAQGQSSTLTFTITNTDDLLPKSGWSFSDTLPPGLTTSGPLGGTCALSASAVTAGSISATGDLAAGQAACTITVQVTSAVPGVYTNSGCVAEGTGAPIPNCTSNVPPPVGLNPPGTARLTVLPVTDLVITKTANVAAYTPGQPITYTVTVRNTGPSDAIDASVRDAPPAAVTGVRWTCAVTAAGTPTLTPSGPTRCTAAGTGAIADTVRVNAGGTIAYTLTGTVAVSASGALTNGATVVPPTVTNVPNQPGGGPNPAPGATTPVATVDPGCAPAPGAGCSATVTRQPRPVRARAVLHGPRNCVTARFRPTVTGPYIRSVTWMVDGRRLARQAAAGASARERVTIDATRWTPGVHRITARVRFVAGATPRARTVTLQVRRCAARVSPRFTG